MSRAFARTPSVWPSRKRRLRPNRRRVPAPEPCRAVQRAGDRGKPVGVGVRPRRLHQRHTGTVLRYRTVSRAQPGISAPVFLRTDRRSEPYAYRSAYKNFLDEVTKRSRTINARFPAGPLETNCPGEEGTTPIRRIERYYRAASVCLVTSLHDAESCCQRVCRFTAKTTTCPDPSSICAGAAFELHDALLVTVHIQQVAGGPCTAHSTCRRRTVCPNAPACAPRSASTYLSLGRESSLRPHGDSN